MIEHKSSGPVEVKLADSGYIEAAFARLNVIDHDGDVTLPGAFPTKDVPMSAFGHTSWEGVPPVGKGTISEQGDWAVFTGNLFMDTTHGRDAHATLKGLGPLAEFSYGFSVLDSEPSVKDGRNVRMLKSLDPFEVSHVLKGAGMGTHLRSIKSGGLGPDMPYADHLAWVLDEVEALNIRSQARADWRAKEGRVLSSANRTSLATIATGLESHAGEIRGLLDATDPQKASRDLTLEVLLGIARRNGVPV